MAFRLRLEPAFEVIELNVKKVFIAPDAYQSPQPNHEVRKAIDGTTQHQKHTDDTQDREAKQQGQKGVDGQGVFTQDKSQGAVHMQQKQGLKKEGDEG